MDDHNRKIRRRIIRERATRIRNARYLPRGLLHELTIGERYPGTSWRSVGYTRNVTFWYHDSFPSLNGYNIHISVIYNDQRGSNRNGRIDVHSTLWQGASHSKIHYGWCVDSNHNEVWRDLDPRVPMNKPIIALLHQFHFDKRILYAPQTYKRMRPPPRTANPFNLL